MSIRVVVTTAGDSLPGLEALLPDPPFHVRRHPLLALLPPPDPAALPRALADGKWSAIACTSPRAAAVLGPLLAAGPADGPPVWAVGPGTARALGAAGPRLRVPPTPEGTTGAAEGLAAAMLGAGVTGRVLFVAGDPHRPELPARLADAGIATETVIAYRQVPVADVELLAALSRADLLVVGSPALVGALAAQGDDARQAGCVALGPTTAEACRAAGLPLVAVAEPSSARGVADAVRRAARDLSLEP